MNITWPDINDVPIINIECDDKRVFSIVILDYDAPTSPYLHMWYQNVCIEHTTDVIVSYAPPSPPHKAEHHYEVRVYKQNLPKLKVTSEIKRAGFNPTAYGLLSKNIIASKTFLSNGTYLKPQ